MSSTSSQERSCSHVIQLHCVANNGSQVFQLHCYTYFLNKRFILYERKTKQHETVLKYE